MQRERIVLQRDVFPRLVNYCNEKKWQFEAVDLRWGISEEAATNQKTMSICLQELERCKKISPKPNFLILLGQRYGWKPLPEYISLSDATTIISNASDEEKDLFTTWYKLDVNAIPDSIYVLQSRYGNYLDYIFYQKEVEAKLYDLFDRATNPDKIVYYASATEQEIYAGALSVEGAKQHVVAYFRELDTIPQNEKNTYADNQENTCRLNLLKVKIEKQLDEEFVIREQCTFTDYESENFDNNFGETIYDTLKKVVDNEINTFSETNAPSHNDYFAEERLRHFVGREQEVASILEWYESKKTSLLVITGESGCGKSTLIAEINRQFKERTSAYVITKYLGIDYESSNGEKIQNKVFSELEKIHPLSDDEKKKTTFRGFIEKISRKNEKPVILMFDAIDQLDTSDISNKKQLLQHFVRPFSDFFFSLSPRFSPLNLPV